MLRFLDVPALHSFCRTYLGLKREMRVYVWNMQALAASKKGAVLYGSVEVWIFNIGAHRENESTTQVPRQCRQFDVSNSSYVLGASRRHSRCASVRSFASVLFTLQIEEHQSVVQTHLAGYH